MACPADRPIVTPIQQGTTPVVCANQACRYGDVTCSCNGGVGMSGWACGVCPATEPGNGTACGNVAFACSYGLDVCACSGTQGWSCQTVTCPTSPTAPGPSGGRSNCPGTTGSLSYTCNYPHEAQTCNCTGGFMTCNCPTAQPADGDACVGTPSCNYGNGTCVCSGGHWQCGGAACPVYPPAPGAACAYPLSCAYSITGVGPVNLCTCDGTSWSCS
jgi:hypothetical protein